MQEDKRECASPYDVSKKLIGFLLFHLGIIGLIIGFHEYPKGTMARKTFVQGFFSPFLIVVIMLVIVAIVFACIG